LKHSDSFLLARGRKLAVLAIDPSSSNTRAAYWATRPGWNSLVFTPMHISDHPFSRNTRRCSQENRETIILCEAAGFDTILVETVGVGQSETAVHSMVDIFLLLMLAAPVMNFRV